MNNIDDKGEVVVISAAKRKKKQTAMFKTALDRIVDVDCAVGVEQFNEKGLKMLIID